MKLIRFSPIRNSDKSAVSLNDFITVKTETSIGWSNEKNTFSCGIFSQTATFTIQVKRSEYEIGIRYFIAKLKNSYFYAGKIKNAVTTLLNEVALSQENVDASTLDLLKVMNYDTGKRYSEATMTF